MTRSRSEGEAVAERIRDGWCVRGCTVTGSHWAACPDYAAGADTVSCRGCAPSPAYATSVVCTRCFGRMRGLLRDVPDLVGRVRSLSDQARATAMVPVKRSSPTTAGPVDQVSADELEAVSAILLNLRDWAHTLATADRAPSYRHTRSASLTAEHATELAADYAEVIVGRLEVVCADVDQVLALAEAVLVIHPTAAGERTVWSIADARARWGVERRDRHVHPDVDDDEPDWVESHAPVREWYDPLLETKMAARRGDVTERQLRKWVAAGVLVPVARVRLPTGHVQKWFRASEVDAAAAMMRARRHAGVALQPE